MFERLKALAKKNRNDKSNNLTDLIKEKMETIEKKVGAKRGRPSKRRLKVADVAKIWYEQKKNSLTTSTRNNYHYWLTKFILPFFGENTSIQTEQIKDFIKQVKSLGYTVGSIRSMVYVVNQIVEFGMKRRILEKSEGLSSKWGVTNAVREASEGNDEEVSVSIPNPRKKRPYHKRTAKEVEEKMAKQSVVETQSSGIPTETKETLKSSVLEKIDKVYNGDNKRAEKALRELELEKERLHKLFIHMNEVSVVMAASVKLCSQHIATAIDALKNDVEDETSDGKDNSLKYLESKLKSIGASDII